MISVTVDGHCTQFNVYMILNTHARMREMFNCSLHSGKERVAFVLVYMYAYIAVRVSLQSGPVFQSGGDEANLCEFSFTWETPGACPVRPAHSSSCSVRDPESGRLYDLSPLAQLRKHFNVSSDG